MLDEIRRRQQVPRRAEHPGTHDSGTCSVDNDTEPQSSQVKCQQDYIPTQLLEGIRYFDIRLGKGDNPGIDHGDYYLLKKTRTFCIFPMS